MLTTPKQINGANIPELTDLQLSERNMWHIYGSDPNPDFSGPHVNKYLGSVECTLRDAIATAKAQSRWSGWGPSDTGYITHEPRVAMLSVVRDVVGDSGKSYEECRNWLDSTTNWLGECKHLFPLGTFNAIASKALYCYGVSKTAIEILGQNFEVHHKGNDSITIYHTFENVRLLFLFSNRSAE